MEGGLPTLSFTAAVESDDCFLILPSVLDGGGNAELSIAFGFVSFGLAQGFELFFSIPLSSRRFIIPVGN